MRMCQFHFVFSTVHEKFGLMGFQWGCPSPIAILPLPELGKGLVTYHIVSSGPCSFQTSSRYRIRLFRLVSATWKYLMMTWPRNPEKCLRTLQNIHANHFKALVFLYCCCQRHARNVLFLHSLSDCKSGGRFFIYIIACAGVCWGANDRHAKN